VLARRGGHLAIANAAALSAAGVGPAEHDALRLIVVL